MPLTPADKASLQTLEPLLDRLTGIGDQGVSDPVRDAFVAGYCAAYRDGGNAHTPERRGYIRRLAEKAWLANIGEPAHGDRHHFGDPCIYCGIPHDEVESGPCREHVVQYVAAELAKSHGLQPERAVPARLGSWMRDARTAIEAIAKVGGRR